MNGLRCTWVMRTDDAMANAGALVERVLRSRGVLGGASGITNAHYAFNFNHASDSEVFLSPRLSQLHDSPLTSDLDRPRFAFTHARRGFGRIRQLIALR